MFNLHIVSRLIEEKKLATAISLLNENTRKVPAYVTPYVMLAKLYETVGNKQGALVAWRSAHRLVPSSKVIKRGIRYNQPIALPPIEHEDDITNKGSTLVRDLVAISAIDDLDEDYTEDLLFDDLDLEFDSISGDDSQIDNNLKNELETTEVNLDEMVDEFFDEMKDSSSSIQGDLDVSSIIAENQMDEEKDDDLMHIIESAPDESAELDRLIEELQEASGRNLKEERLNKEDSDDDDGDVEVLEPPNSLADKEVDIPIAKEELEKELNLEDLLESNDEDEVGDQFRELENFQAPLPTDLNEILLDENNLLTSDSNSSETDSRNDELLQQDDVVSETLARIYISQKKYVEAARVYKILSEQHPERSGAFLERAKELRVMAAELED